MQQSITGTNADQILWRQIEPRCHSESKQQTIRKIQATYVEMKARST